MTLELVIGNARYEVGVQPFRWGYWYSISRQLPHRAGLGVFVNWGSW